MSNPVYVILFTSFYAIYLFPYSSSPPFTALFVVTLLFISLVHYDC
jgi:hypothetical protein